MSDPPIKPGRVLLTAYGVAVVICTDGNGSSFKARIWRHVGKSVASSTTAYLNNSCVIKELPAAPGMVTEFMASHHDICTKDDVVINVSKIMIHCYSPSKDEYTVSYINDDSAGNTHLDLLSTLSGEDIDEKANEDINAEKNEQLFQLKPSKISPAKCAQFYPLIDELMHRGNEAASSAKAMVRNNPKFLELTESMSKDSVDEFSNSDALLSGIGKITKVTDKVTDKLKNAVPDSTEVDGIYKMLKDEELTVLLANGRDRLQQLVSGGLKESTHQALKEMGLEINTDGNGSMSSAMVQAQEKALATLDDLLADNLDVTLETVQSTLGKKFGTMFDSLATAAKSDGTLENILGEISEKTSEWQTETGRLLSTKSTSLFMEGTQRFQTRVGNILSPVQLAMVEKSGADLTKAFTEGDIAVAKLKSIELGESVRSRLFAAIEIRSETQGGLDSIIAGALSQIGSDSIGDMLTDFKNSATASSENAHESLISLLSERSQYHDISIQKIERVLVDIESHLGEDMSPEKIVSLARGEGGTAAIFKPIANRAAQEIEKQLDVAEESIEDERILVVISHVRKIMSGNLTLTSLVDEISIVLNSDDAVHAGTTLAQTGEQILDALEGASENKALSDVFGAVEKAGITKESVIGQLENLNVGDVLDTAGEAVSDEKKRMELLSSATDSALEFLLKILPSLPVLPFEGVRDGLIYSIKNLSMHGFKLKKEDIMVEIAGIRAAGQTREGLESFVQREVNAADILVVDIRNISAVFENAIWSFEQTYMPYLKGNGHANVEVSEGHMRLEFELKKRERVSTGGSSWEPVLCLKTRTCSITQLSISFEGASRLTWVANRLAKMLKNPLRDYVVRVIIDLLGTKSGWLLENLNGVLSANWDIIMKTTKLNIDGLDIVNKNDIVAVIDDIYANEIDLVWTEFVPLGINLLLNDKSGFIKVVDFPRGSQARKVAVDKELDPDDFKGATITSVNGSNCSNKERVDILLALRDPSRPKTIKFSLKPKEKAAQNNLPTKPIAMITAADNRAIKMNRLVITEEGPIGIKFAKSPDNTCLALVDFCDDGKGQESNSDGTVRTHDILTLVNDSVVIGEDITSVERVLEREGRKRPLSLCFMPPYIHTFTFKTKDEHGDPMIGGPNEFILEQFKSQGLSKICIKGYKEVDGSVESRGIFLGDHLIFINGVPVGTGLQLRPDCPQLTMEQIYDMLNDVKSFPICLTFARPRSKARNAEFNVESSETKNMSVIAISPHQLGFDVGQGAKDNHLVVKKFLPVKGSLQVKIEDMFGSGATTGLSFYSINGEKIPSYANCEIVLNAMKRAWAKNAELELVLCNEAIKQNTIDQSTRN